MEEVEHSSRAFRKSIRRRSAGRSWTFAEPRSGESRRGSRSRCGLGRSIIPAAEADPTKLDCLGVAAHKESMLDGERIRKARLRKRPEYPDGMSQRQLAERMGLETGIVSRYETGRILNPTLSSVELLAEILDVKITDLLKPNPPGYIPRAARKPLRS